MANEENEAPKSGGSMTVILAAVVALLVGAAGTFAVTRMTAPEPAPDEVEDVELADGEVPPEAPLEDRMVELEPFVVNLGGAGPPRYLKARLSLELEGSEEVAKAEEHLPKIRDAIIVLLSSRRLADMQEFEGKVLIKEDILDRVNGVLGSPSVAAVLFTEFVVQ